MQWHLPASTAVSRTRPKQSAGFEPVQFERLGQVPNELDIVGDIAMPAGRTGDGSAPVSGAIDRQ